MTFEMMIKDIFEDMKEIIVKISIFLNSVPEEDIEDGDVYNFLEYLMRVNNISSEQILNIENPEEKMHDLYKELMDCFHNVSPIIDDHLTGVIDPEDYSMISDVYDCLEGSIGEAF